jgi:hypothetical protein
VPLAQAKNGDQQFWKKKFHAGDEKAQHALMNDPVSFSFLLKGPGTGISSGRVPKFPKCS